MRVLLTNDDGVQADGLLTLREVLLAETSWQVEVVAPERERSAIGHAITLHKPLQVRVLEQGERGTVRSVNGTPADCAKLGIKALLEATPDLLISGINRGANLGNDVFYSGTVSAALEGALLGVPSLAVSLVAEDPASYRPAAEALLPLFRAVVRSGLPQRSFLNVNLPERPGHFRLTRLAHREWEDAFEQRLDPRGRPYFWMAGVPLPVEIPEGTDVAAVEEGDIAVSPVRAEWHDPHLHAVLSSWPLFTEDSPTS